MSELTRLKRIKIARLHQNSKFMSPWRCTCKRRTILKPIDSHSKQKCVLRCPKCSRDHDMVSDETLLRIEKTIDELNSMERQNPWFGT